MKPRNNMININLNISSLVTKEQADKLLFRNKDGIPRINPKELSKLIESKEIFVDQISSETGMPYGNLSISMIQINND